MATRSIRVEGEESSMINLTFRRGRPESQLLHTSLGVIHHSIPACPLIHLNRIPQRSSIVLWKTQLQLLCRVHLHTFESFRLVMENRLFSSDEMAMFLQDFEFQLVENKRLKQLQVYKSGRWSKRLDLRKNNQESNPLWRTARILDELIKYQIKSVNENEEQNNDGKRTRDFKQARSDWERKKKLHAILVCLFSW